MSYQVTIGAGKKDVVLPNGSRYQAGAVVELSDAEYAQLSPSALSTLMTASSDGGLTSWTVTLNTGLVNVVLPNGCRYKGGDVVKLSEAQYSTIDAAAISALFASVSSAVG